MLFSDTESALIAAEAARRTSQFAFIGTILTMLITVIVAFLTQRSNKKTQHELKQLELNNSETLARLNAVLGERKSEEDARRDYDYEARKRLYREAEPLLFHLSEASENALHRIFSLVRTARRGDLGPKQSSWLRQPGYYMATTIYDLLAPVVIFRLLQDRLTLVDLTRDRRISNHYLLAKWLHISFTDDFVLAQMEPLLEYAPFINGWEKKRLAMPEKHWRQGHPLGKLDVSIETMVKPAQDGPGRCMSFGEFETAFYKDLKSDESKFAVFADMFLNFHPARRPILWRILVVQAHLHAALMGAFLEGGATGFVTDVPTNFLDVDLARIDWRDPTESLEETIIQEPVHVARAYLHKRLPILFKE
jgi:hypothetical protein